MRTGIWVIGAMALLASWASRPTAAQERQDPGETRHRFVVREFSGRGWKLASRQDLPGFGPGFQVLVLGMDLPEADEKGRALGPVNRLLVLDGEWIEFDSFVDDGIDDAVEPSLQTPTFFQLKWSVLKGKRPLLVLQGIVPTQGPGEPLQTGQRTWVLGWTPREGFESQADVVARRPAQVGPTEVRVPLP